MVLHQKPSQKADFIVKTTGPVMVRPASSDKLKAPLVFSSEIFFFFSGMYERRLIMSKQGSSCQKER